MRKHKAVNTSIGVGTSSILMIFILLTLITFASLSLVSANADQKLTEKAAVYAQEYNEASNKAQKILSMIDQKMANGDLVNTISGVEVNGEICQFEVPISEGQSIVVVVHLLRDGEHYYEVMTYETKNESEWNADERLPVYQP